MCHCWPTRSVYKTERPWKDKEETEGAKQIEGSQPVNKKGMKKAKDIWTKKQYQDTDGNMKRNK